MINFGRYRFLYDAETYFNCMDRFGTDLFSKLNENSLEGWKALKYVLSHMSERGAARAKREGVENVPVLTEKDIEDYLDMTDLKESRQVVFDAIIRGCGGSEDKERDLVLEELEKKADAD